jgi:hypothetical protein
MVQVLNKRWAGLIIYFLGILGTILLIALLLPVVLIHMIVLARPHLEGGPQPVSLIQQRQIDAALALPPSPTQVTTPVIAAQVPTGPLALYAAQLDLAEKEETTTAFPEVAAFELESDPSSIASKTEKLRVAHAGPSHTLLTARDVFNQSFGVITAAAN